MDIQQAKTFVRSLNNSAAKILISFLLARTALGIDDLREWTGLKRETLYGSLDILRSSGYVERQIGEHGKHIWVPSGDFLPGIFQMSEKRTPELQMSTKRTPESLVVGGGDSELIKLNPTPTTNSQMSTKRTSEVARLLQQTHLLFDGSFVNSKGLDDCDPDTVLAWCAYGYEQARDGKSHSPAGLVRSKLLTLEPAPQHMLDHWATILPEQYLEAIGRIEYQCDFCAETFEKRAGLDEHVRSRHQYICEDCRPAVAFGTQTEWQAHYNATHNPYTPKAEKTAQTAEGGSLADQLWSQVQSSLADEMPRASWETWVRDARAVRYDGNMLTVAARNAYAADWLKQRLNERAARLLSEAVQVESKVEFVVL